MQRFRRHNILHNINLTKSLIHLKDNKQTNKQKRKDAKLLFLTKL